MNKKLILIFASLAVAGCASAATSRLTPFQDNLTVRFQNFPSNTLVNLSYLDNNGVNIAGPASTSTDADANVRVYSSNTVESGIPSMTLQYPTKFFGTQHCNLTFIDGPWVKQLAYESGNAPLCLGITVGNITRDPTQGSNYTVVISDTAQ